MPRALGFPRGIVLPLEPGIQLGDFLAALAEVVLEGFDPLLEVFEKGGSVDHGKDVARWQRSVFRKTRCGVDELT